MQEEATAAAAAGLLISDGGYRSDSSDREQPREHTSSATNENKETKKS
jgi:hypothetical protein